MKQTTRLAILQYYASESTPRRVVKATRRKERKEPNGKEKPAMAGRTQTTV